MFIFLWPCCHPCRLQGCYQTQSRTNARLRSSRWLENLGHPAASLPQCHPPVLPAQYQRLSGRPEAGSPGFVTHPVRATTWHPPSSFYSRPSTRSVVDGLILLYKVTCLCVCLCDSESVCTNPLFITCNKRKTWTNSHHHVTNGKLGLTPTIM